MTTAKKRIVVVGAGIAGITAAYLAAKKHDVVLLEKNNYLGGHTNTYTITHGVDKGIRLDTGFIVFNDKTYPQFTKILDEWKVQSRYSDMSFGFWDKKTDFRYAYTSFNGVFAQRANLFNYRFWKLSYELIDFFRRSNLALQRQNLDDLTLGEYIQIQGISQELQDKYLLPMGSAVWSIPFSKLLEFPALSFLRFFERHGLLSVSGRPHWQTIEGGSQTYVEAFKRCYKGDFVLNAKIAIIKRNAEGIEIFMEDGSTFRCDTVIIATHADEALKLLEKPTIAEQKCLSAWTYENNDVVLHTDRSIMPEHKRAWASWNFHRKQDGDPCLVTYHLNRLQGLNCHHDYFVTLNSYDIDNSKIISKMIYSHPVYTKEALKTQKGIADLNGEHNTYFCGSYCGYGFHEDAVKSAIDAINKINGE